LKTGVPTIGAGPVIDVSFALAAFEAKRGETATGGSLLPEPGAGRVSSLEASLTEMKDAIGALIAASHTDKERHEQEIKGLRGEILALTVSNASLTGRVATLGARLDEKDARVEKKLLRIDAMVPEMVKKAVEDRGDVDDTRAVRGVEEITRLEGVATELYARLKEDEVEIRQVLDDLTTRADTILAKIVVPAVAYAAPPGDPSGENDWTDAFTSVSRSTAPSGVQTEQSLVTVGGATGGYVYE
jgi:hypothetical protein